MECFVKLIIHIHCIAHFGKVVSLILISEKALRILFSGTIKKSINHWQLLRYVKYDGNNIKEFVFY